MCLCVNECKCKCIQWISSPTYSLYIAPVCYQTHLSYTGSGYTRTHTHSHTPFMSRTWEAHMSCTGCGHTHTHSHTHTPFISRAWEAHMSCTGCGDTHTLTHQSCHVRGQMPLLHLRHTSIVHTILQHFSAASSCAT